MLRIALVVVLAGAAGAITSAHADSITFGEVVLAQNTDLDGTSYYSAYGVWFSGGTIYKRNGRFSDGYGITSNGNPENEPANSFRVNFFDAVDAVSFDWSLLGSANDIHATAYSSTGAELGIYTNGARSGTGSFSDIGPISSILFSDSGQQVGLDALEFSRERDLGSAFLFLPVGGGMLPYMGEEGLVTNGDLALSFTGFLNGGFPGNGISFVDSYDFDGVTILNGTEWATIWGVDAVGFSPHTYSGDPLEVSPEVQAAVEAGMELLRNQDPMLPPPPELLAFPELIGFNEPGELAFISPEQLVAYFAQFGPPPESPEFGVFQDELTAFLFAVDYATIDFSEDALRADGEDILFPHQPSGTFIQQDVFFLLDGSGGITGFGGSTRVVPEPGGLALLAAGFAVILCVRRRRPRS